MFQVWGASFSKILYHTAFNLSCVFCLVVLVVLFAVSKIALLQLYVEKLFANTTPEMY